MSRIGIKQALFIAAVGLMATHSSFAKTHTVSRVRPRQSSGAAQPQSPSVLKGQIATLLPDGSWLLSGGEGHDSVLDVAYLVDSSSGTKDLLTSKMIHGRAWHTATVLPDGSVLIFGGVDANGKVIDEAELFTPRNQQFSALKTTGLSPRAHHTATLLLDGQTLIAGGTRNDGEVSDELQLWDPKTQAAMMAASELKAAVRDQTATLLPTGEVLFWGGIDRFGNPVNYGQAYDPMSQSVRFQVQPPLASAPGDLLRVTMSMPDDGSTDVAINSVVSVLFSRPIRVLTFEPTTAVLIGPQGNISATSVPAEGGMLGFVTPGQPLVAGTTYSLVFNGVSDPSGQPLYTPQISFTTKKDNSSSGGSSSGSGGGMPMGGGMNEPFDPKWEKLPPLHAGKGITALAGQALQVNGKPLKHVKIEIEDDVTHTDETGRFLLKHLSLGHHVMNVYGETAEPKQPYGFFQIAVDIDKKGETNVLPFTMFIPVLDVAHATHFSVPTDKEVVATSPSFPGMEVHIPAGEILRWVDGKPINEVTLTPIPMMQMPMPGPPGVETPVSFTLQADGAVDELPDGSVGAGVRIIFPNLVNLPPGRRANFWTYDPKIKGGWFIYGQGTVTPDGKQIVPDPGVVIHRLSCSPFNIGPTPPGTGPGDHSGPDGGGSGHGEGGEPVDLATGLFVYQKTDLEISDIIPIVFSRTYRQLDNNSREFGIGTSQSYGWYLYNYGLDDFSSGVDLVLPDGGRVHYSCITTDCSGGSSTILQASSDPGPFFMSQLTLSPILYQGAQIYAVRLKNGTVYGFLGGGGTGRLAYIRDRNGNQLSISFDGNQRPIQITSPGGRWLKLTYDTSSRITQIQDNIGRTLSYGYDANGCLHTVTDGGGGLWTYTYDSSNNLKTITDARQNLYLTNQYDGNNRVVQQTLADNSIYQYRYTLDANGTIIQTNVTNPRGDIRIVTFNTSEYWVSDTEDSAGAAPRAFIGNRQANTNLITTTTDGLGRQMSISYDVMGNVLSVTRLAGTSQAVTTSFTYEPTFNQAVSVKDPLGQTTQFSYDPNGNLIALTDALGNQTSFTYNAHGQPLTLTDALGNRVSFTYDLLSLDLVGITDALNRTTTSFFDGIGRLVTSTNSAGQTTRVAYNPLNQVTTVTDRMGNVTALGYDPNGNLQSVVDANQHTTQYTYENMNRVATRKDALLNSEAYQYDSAGNLTQFTDRRGKITTFNYDSLNRRTFVGYGTVMGNPNTYESTVSYNYDAADRVTQAVDSAYGTISWVYDGLDDLLSETTPAGAVSYSYDNAQRQISLNVPGQSVVNYAYDRVSRLKQITQGSSVVQFTYDAAGRRTGLVLPNGVTANYAYDAASQFTSVKYVIGSTTLGDLNYAYDVLGRRGSVGGSFARTNLPNAVTTTGYNANNQLTTWGTANLFYDLNGNMTSDGTHSYTWDARNRLSQVDNGSTASFAYDMLGRRSSKSILGTTTSFVYNGADAVQEVIGGSNTANSLTGGVDEVFQRADAAGARSFLADGLGSTLALADSTGTVQTSYTYDPFGNTNATGGSSSNTFAYTGRELDASSLNLYFYRARYYNPTLQRFISEDPMGLAAGLNPYAYALNNPINLVDPFGLDCGRRLSGMERLKLAGLGVFHSVLGASKIGAGAAAEVATEGLATPIVVYGVVNGVANIGTGAAEISAAIIGDRAAADAAEEFSNVSSAATTVTGLVTLGVTRDPAKAAKAGKIEGLILTPLQGGLGAKVSPLDVADEGETVLDLAGVSKKKKCTCE
jgi:RHS repeat-associated protein